MSERSSFPIISSWDRLSRAVAASDRATAVVLLLCTIPMIAFVTAEISPRAHVALSAAMVVVALLVATGWPRLRIVVMLLSIVVSARYIWYRAIHTMVFELSLDSLAAYALFGAEIYAFVVLLCGYFQTAIVRRRAPAPIDLADPNLPMVDVFVPTYNEDLDLLRDTLLAAKSMEYPNKEIWLLDDGRRPAAKALAESLGCRYLNRIGNKGAKAGNINAALEKTNAPLIAFFDADHVPVRTFLTATVGFFLEDPNVGLVQTPHYFYNPDQFETNLHTQGIVPPEQKLFYHAIQAGNDFWNASFFCGSCAVFRREAMMGVGGMAEETLTEDAHTALKMHGAGWRSVYLDVPLAAGIATERLVVFIGQRIRWARGMAQVFRLDNPLLKRGLTVAQRICYFSASWHFMFGIPRLVFLLAPLTYLLFGLHPMFADVREVLVFATPHLVLAWIATAAANRHYRHSFWPEVFEVVMAPYAALVTTMALLSPHGGSFKVTAKGETLDRATFDWRSARPILVLIGLSVAGAIGTAVRFYTAPLDRATVAVAGAWNLYNLLILCAAAGTAMDRPQRRARHRVRRRVRAVVTPDEIEDAPIEWDGETVDIAPGGARLRLRGHPILPEIVAMRLEDEHVRGAWMPADVLEQREEGEWTVVRLRFHPLDEHRRNALVHFLFTPPDSWVQDRYTVDRPIRAALAVALSPIVAFTGRGDLMRRLMAGGTPVPIVLPREGPVCPRCETHMDRAATACIACGHEPAARRWRFGRPSFPVATFAGLLSVLAIGIGAAEVPVIKAFDGVISLDTWAGATYATRLAQLGQAWRDMDALRGELAGVHDAGGPLRKSWPLDLARVGRSYQLGNVRLNDAPARAAEAELVTALRLLEEAGALYLRHGPSPICAARLRAASSALDQAAVALGIPR